MDLNHCPACGADLSRLGIRYNATQRAHYVVTPERYILITDITEENCADSTEGVYYCPVESCGAALDLTEEQALTILRRES